MAMLFRVYLAQYNKHCCIATNTNGESLRATRQCHIFCYLLPTLLAAGFGLCPAIIGQVIHKQPGQVKQLEAVFVILQYLLRNDRGINFTFVFPCIIV